MADINPVNESAKAFQVANIKNQDNAKTDDAFDKLFSKALDKTEASEMESSSTGLLQEIAAPENLKFISSSDIVSRKTGDLLDMLDSYSASLKNPDVSLKSIAPVLEKINKSAGSLLEEAGQLPEADSGLKKIATQTIVTAQTEYAKFQRGDYLS
jgi:hypothetical protein